MSCHPLDQNCNEFMCENSTRLNNILPASEAKRMTQNALDTNISEQLSKIANEIEAAASKGKFQIIALGFLDNEIRIQLKKSGYKINSFWNGYESYCTISWE